MKTTFIFTRKILCVILSFTLLTLALVACANPTDGTGETTVADDTTTKVDDSTTPEDTESTTPEDIETTTPEEESSTSSDNTTPYVEPLFINYYDITLNDLYTLLTERSNDLSDYEKLGPGGGPLGALLKSMPEANVLITLEDMNLQSEALMDTCEGVEVYVKNPVYEYKDEVYYMYYYHFDSVGMGIQVFYAPERVSKDGQEDDSRPRMEGGLSAFLANPSEEYVYTEKIGDYSVDYYRYVDYFEGISYSYKNLIRVYTDDFCVGFSQMFSTVHDNPTCEEIEKFFSEETYRDAILQLIEGIENRE